MTDTNNNILQMNDLRQRAVDIAVKEDNSVNEKLSPEQMQHQLYELRVHQIELEMQNEELRRTQHELEASRARYLSIIEDQTELICRYLPDGRLSFVNTAYSRYYGKNRCELINTKFAPNIPEADLSMILNYLAEISPDNPVKCFTHRIINSDGEVRWQRWTQRGIYSADGTLTEYQAVGFDITEHKLAKLELIEVHDKLESKVAERTSTLALANEEMKRVSFALVWAEERERERIASELHDRVGQSLLLAKMKLDGLAESIPTDSLRICAEEASALIADSIQDIRSLTFKMRPPILNTTGIETALEWLCSSINNDYGIQVDFVDDCLPKPLSAEVRYSLYQAVRELLLNIVKHAGCDKARLSLKTENKALFVQVADKGVGFSHPDAIMKHVNNGGYGLYNVQQRIEQMGGICDVKSAPGSGTSVTLMVPFSEDGF